MSCCFPCLRLAAPASAAGTMQPAAHQQHDQGGDGGQASHVSGDVVLLWAANQQQRLTQQQRSSLGVAVCWLLARPYTLAVHSSLLVAPVAGAGVGPQHLRAAGCLNCSLYLAAGGRKERRAVPAVRRRQQGAWSTGFAAGQQGKMDGGGLCWPFGSGP